MSGYALGVVGLIALIAGGFIAYANYRFDNPRYASDRHYQVVYGEDSSFALPNNMIVIGASPEPPPVYTLMPVYEQMPDQRPNVQPQVQVLIVTATPEQLTFPPNWLTVTPVMHIDCTKYICTRIEYNFTPTPTNTLVDFPSMADRDAWFATFTPAPP